MKRIRSFRWLVVAPLVDGAPSLALVAATSLTLVAATLDLALAHGDCIALREKLSGAKCKNIAACYVRQATHGDDSAACVAEQRDRLVQRFAREYDLRHDCPDYGEAADVVAILDAAFTDLASTLVVDGNRCATAKIGAAAKSCVALLRDCHALAQRKHIPVDPPCFDEVAAKMTGAFDRAEGRFTCATNDDDAAVRMSVETAVGDVVSELTTEP